MLSFRGCAFWVGGLDWKGSEGKGGIAMALRVFRWVVGLG